MRANAISSQSFIRPAMFELELEWMVEVEGRGLGNSEKKLCTFFINNLHTNISKGFLHTVSIRSLRC